MLGRPEVFALLITLGLATVSPGAGVAAAAAIITNGTVTLGVNDTGQLNVEDGGPPSPVWGTTALGLRLDATGNEALGTGARPRAGAWALPAWA